MKKIYIKEMGKSDWSQEIEIDSWYIKDGLVRYKIGANVFFIHPVNIKIREESDK